MFERMHVGALALCLALGWAASDAVAQPAENLSRIEVTGMPLEVVEIMVNQVEAWNRADLPSFMSGYWESDSLMFVGSSGVTLGHQATLDRYLKSYPDASAMGQLTFENLTWISLSATSGWLLGAWHLAKESREDAEGMYTLLWRKVKGRWVIVADHSS
ncbi:MAG: YybH family protein [Flavobacteriales bacterium]